MKTTRTAILLITLFVVPLLASAEPLEPTPGGGPDVAARLGRDLEARVGEVLDRRVALAAERAMATLERREAAQLEGLARAAAAQAEPPRSVSVARRARRVALADGIGVVRVAAPSRVERSD